MSKFTMNFSKFKKKSSDKASTTLVHPAGHEIRIAHAALSPEHREALSALPMYDGGKVDAKPSPSPLDDQDYKKSNVKSMEKEAQDSSLDPSTLYNKAKSAIGMADGGEVADSAPDSQQPATPQPITINVGGGTPNIPQQFMNPTPGSQAIAQSNGQGVSFGQAPETDLSPSKLPYGVSPQQALSAAPQAQEEPQAEAPKQQSIAPQQAPSAPQGMSDPYGANATADIFSRGLNEQVGGIAGQAAAASKQAAMDKAVLGQQVQAQQKAAQTYQEHYNGLDQERQNFQNDIKNNLIDPNHYMNSQSAGSKVSTAIGLILGGFGGGGSGQQNGAQAYLNDQINRDIAAQEKNLGARQNLLSANLAQFGNMRDATAMTRVMMNDILSNKIQQDAAATGGQLAQARAQAAIGALHQQSAGMMGQMAMRKTLLSGMAAGQVSPDKIVEFLVPEKDRPEATKELKEAQDTTSMRDNLLSAFDQLNQSNTVGNRVAHLGFTPASVSAVRDPLLAAMSKGTAGRFTEADAHMLLPLFPAPGDAPDTLAVKRRQLNSLISEKMHFPKLKSWGIDANSFGRYNGQGSSNIPFQPKE